MSPELAQAIGLIIGAALAFIIKEFAVDRPRSKRNTTAAKTATEDAQTAKTATDLNAENIKALLETTADLRDQLEARDARIASVEERAKQAEAKAAEAYRDAVEKSVLIAELKEQAAGLNETIQRIAADRETRGIELEDERRRSEALESRVRTLENENLKHQLEIVRLKAELEAYKSIIQPFFERLTLVIHPDSASAEQKADAA